MTSLSSSSTRGIGFRCAVLSGASAEASNSASAENFPGILGQLDRAVKGTRRRTSMASGINNSIDTSAVMRTIHENRRSYQHGAHCDACNTLYSAALKTCGSGAGSTFKTRPVDQELARAVLPTLLAGPDPQCKGAETWDASKTGWFLNRWTIRKHEEVQPAYKASDLIEKDFRVSTRTPSRITSCFHELPEECFCAGCGLLS